MKWIKKTVKLPKDNKRVITYSPAYENNNQKDILFRVMGGDFVHRCIEVTHWAELKSPEDQEEQAGQKESGQKESG